MPRLGDVASAAPFIAVNKQSESNPDCNIHSTAYIVSVITYHQNLSIKLSEENCFKKPVREPIDCRSTSSFIIQQFTKDYIRNMY